MDPQVILRVYPRLKAFVEFFEGDPLGDGREKLHPDGLVESLDFAFALRPVGGAVNKSYTQRGSAIIEVVRPEVRSVIDIELTWKAAFSEGLPQCVVETFYILPKIELRMRDETGVVVDQSKAEGLPLFSINDNQGTMQTI